MSESGTRFVPSLLLFGEDDVIELVFSWGFWIAGLDDARLCSLKGLGGITAGIRDTRADGSDGLCIGRPEFAKTMEFGEIAVLGSFEAGDGATDGLDLFLDLFLGFGGAEVVIEPGIAPVG